MWHEGIKTQRSSRTHGWNAYMVATRGYHRVAVRMNGGAHGAVVRANTARQTCNIGSHRMFSFWQALHASWGK